MSFHLSIISGAIEVIEIERTPKFLTSRVYDGKIITFLCLLKTLLLNIHVFEFREDSINQTC